jgi:tRNA threonylcarbamoyladenosine biosynthesis protein TsaB
MNFLGIDTSWQNLSISFMHKGKIVFDFNRKLKYNASFILPYLEKFIKRKIFSLKEIDALVVGSGPGSFTGLRISFSVIKALSITLGKPVIKLGSFFSYAYPFMKKYEKIAVINDARRNLIYAASFRVKNGVLIKERKEKLTRLEDFVKEKKDYFFVSGDKILCEKLSKFPYLKFHSKAVYPKAKYLLVLAKRNFLENKFTPLEKLEPLYLYPKTCQIRSVSGV